MSSYVEGLNGEKVSIDEIQPYPFKNITIVSYAFLVLIIGTGILEYLGFGSNTFSFLRTAALVGLAFTAVYVLRKDRPRGDVKISLVGFILLPMFTLYFILSKIVKSSESRKIKLVLAFCLIFSVGLVLLPCIMGFPIINNIIKLSITNFDMNILLIWLHYFLNVFSGLTIIALGPIYLLVNGKHPKAEKHATIVLWALIIYFLISITYFRLAIFPS